MRLIYSFAIALSALMVEGVLAQTAIVPQKLTPELLEKSKEYQKKVREGTSSGAESGNQSIPTRIDATATPGQIFCCDDANGRKICGDFLPDVCQSRAYEVRDSKGYVMRTVEAPLTPEQHTRRLAENARKAEEQKKALEERRRTQALLSTYSSDTDIDRARDRELAETDKAMAQAQKRLDEALQKSKKLDSEKEFYKGKALPANVKGQIRDNDAQIKTQKDNVEARLKDKDDIRAKYAEEKKRYLELTGKKATPVVVAPTPVSDPAAKSTGGK